MTYRDIITENKMIRFRPAHLHCCYDYSALGVDSLGFADQDKQQSGEEREQFRVQARGRLLQPVSPHAQVATMFA